MPFPRIKGSTNNRYKIWTRQRESKSYNNNRFDMSVFFEIKVKMNKMKLKTSSEELDI